MEKSNSSSSGHFGECVALITAKREDKENAMPATWTIPVSFSPRLVAVNIAPERFTHDMIKESGKFGVCLLAEDQIQLSKKLGSSSGRDTDKLKDVNKFYGELEIPLIEDCVACLECNVTDSLTEGDHTVFTGEVINVYATDKNPLLLYRGEYYKLGDSLGGY
jgi:flavin reductase (DIM6/NTAB) family NADH-FMN oxidoreductase RutF